MTLSPPLSVLLATIGRDSTDLVAILSKGTADADPMLTHWCSVADAADVAETVSRSGTQHVWYGVQPMTRPAAGRGKSKDVTSVITLYADLDYYDPIHKPNGVTALTALAIVDDLADLLQMPASVMVASGNGVQPYWPIKPVDPITGAIILLRWRQLVLMVASKHGATIDTGVYDLPRILRVPGPPNPKHGLTKVTGLIRPDVTAAYLTTDQLTAVFDSYVPTSANDPDSLGQAVNPLDLHASGLPRRDRSMDQSVNSDRVFDDAEAQTYLAARLKVIAETPWGAGHDYWKVLWEQTQGVAMFSEMYDESDLKAQIRAAIESGHGAAANTADEYQISLGFLKFDGEYARRPDPHGNPFGPDAKYLKCVRIAGVGEGDEELRARYDIPADVPLTTEVVYAVEPPGQAVIPPWDGERRLKVTPASQMVMQAATWLWEHQDEFWLPLRSLVLLGGREGVGKSTWTARLLAQVTRGDMEGEYLGIPKGVVIAAAEDSWEVTILPRLVAARADLSRVFRVDAEANGATFGLTLPTDVPALETLVKDKDVALIVLDPLLGTIVGKLDTHKDSDVRQALAPISALAHETRATVLGLIHQNKSQSGDLMTRMMGSRAFGAVARAVLCCAENPEDDDGLLVGAVAAGYDPANPPKAEEVRQAVAAAKAAKPPRSFLFGQLKNNLGPRVFTSVRYEIQGAVVGVDPETGKPIRTSKIKVVDYDHPDGLEETVMAKEKVATKTVDKRRNPDGNATDRCQAAILLELVGAPMTGSELKAAMEKLKFSESSVKKAMPALISADKIVKSGAHGAYIYSLAGGPA